LVDEVAIERELADERIDLLQRQRRRGPALEVPAQEAVGWSWMWVQTVWRWTPAWRARARRASVPAGVRAGRSESAMR
jgi:hypothetical protein